MGISWVAVLGFLSYVARKKSRLKAQHRVILTRVCMCVSLCVAFALAHSSFFKFFFPTPSARRVAYFQKYANEGRVSLPDNWTVAAVLKETITGSAVYSRSTVFPTPHSPTPPSPRWLECQWGNGLQEKAKESHEKLARCNLSITNSCSSSSEEHQEGVLKCFHFADFSSVTHTCPQHSLYAPSLLWLFKLASEFSEWWLSYPT